MRWFRVEFVGGEVHRLVYPDEVVAANQSFAMKATEITCPDCKGERYVLKVSGPGDSRLIPCERCSVTVEEGTPTPRAVSLPRGWID